MRWLAGPVTDLMGRTGAVQTPHLQKEHKIDTIHTKKRMRMRSPAAKEEMVSRANDWSAWYDRCRSDPSPAIRTQDLTRVVDPEPDWIRIQWGVWIRIRIRNPDPDPGARK
jgi:hypothetical protein